jgi:hypothetical protein
LGSKSIQKGCYVRSISFTVNVVDSSGNSKQQADLIAQQSYALFSIGNVHFTLGLLLLIAAGLVFLSCIRSCCIYFFYPNINRNGNKLVYSNWWYLGYFFFMCCFCPPKEGEKIVEKKKKRVYSVWFFIGLWFGLCCLCLPKLEDVDDDGDKLKANRSESSEDDIGSSIDADDDDDDKIVYLNLSKLQSNSKKLINSGEKVNIRKTLMKSPYERYCMEEELKDCEESNNDGSQALQHTVISKIGQRPLFIRPKRPTVGEAANRQVNNSSRNPFDDIENGLPKVQPSTPLASVLTPKKPLASLLSVIFITIS